ncbi:hypothetical protein K445DRAFT_8829 [Daldinia sp. EC12]|nr:hypothetical protein K445DRAFT_8829 [Daldinia sp. EC12]
MRLLNVHTMQLDEVLDVEDAPAYAILSHTWGKDEVTFQSLHNEEIKSTTGYRKIEYFCLQAIRDGFDYAWVDTCCIDKKDPTELSEAINSMFRWYQMSSVCYVYLSDVEVDERGYVGSPVLEKSRWFRRGWTLQELLAPRRIIFFDRNWRAFGRLRCYDTALHLPDIIEMLPSITRIDIDILQYRDQVEDAPAAEKLSWASHRQTTRKEDIAYCLLGILGISMPLLYGEGEKAFARLQEEYIKQHNDPSLLIWGFGLPCHVMLSPSKISSPLAPSPSVFAGFSSLSLILEKNRVPFSFARTNNGVEVELLLLPLDGNIRLALFGFEDDFYSCYRGILGSSLFGHLSAWKATKNVKNCAEERVIAVPLKYYSEDSRAGYDVYGRILSWPPFLIQKSFCKKAKWKKTCLTGAYPGRRHRLYGGIKINIRALLKHKFSLKSVCPPRDVSLQANTLNVSYGIEYEQCILTFEGPNDQSFGLLLDDRFRDTIGGSALIRDISVSDLLDPLVLQSSTLPWRARETEWLTRVRKRLHMVGNIEISGEQLERFDMDHLNIVLSGRGKELTLQCEPVLK